MRCYGRGNTYASGGLGDRSTAVMDTMSLLCSALQYTRGLAPGTLGLSSVVMTSCEKKPGRAEAAEAQTARQVAVVNLMMNYW